MIKIVDSTLAMVDHCLPSKEQVLKFCYLMKDIGIVDLEISVKIYTLIENLPEGFRFYLTLKTLESIKAYPGIYKLIIPRGQAEEIMSQIQMNDIREVVQLRTYEQCSHIRIVGLDDLLCHNYTYVMQEMITTLKNSKVNLCPENMYHCATAIAVEWALKGGKEITTSFTGIGGLAATEEVLMALRIVIRYKINQDISTIAQLKALIEQITKKDIPKNKPIIGDDIFCVESGIHVDGIMKKETIYEAYSPTEVGQKRTIVMGKHSGSSAVVAKLKECHMPLLDDMYMNRLLQAVKQVSMKKRRSISDEEFIVIARKVMAYERKEKDS